MLARLSDHSTGFKVAPPRAGGDLYYRGGRLCANVGGRELFGCFQPILSFAHQRVVGCEGLVRSAAPGGARYPADLFEKADLDRRIALDRACVSLHVQNFHALDLDDVWLFLNLDPAALCAYTRGGDVVAEVLATCGLPASSVVIEVLERPVADVGAIEDAVAYYRQLGCMVAIDDFGAGHSNFQRIWDLTPDMVKLDRGMLLAAARDKRIRRSLPSIVTLLHQTGCLVVAEGIETEDQALIAMDANVDLVQGFLFARPSEITQPMDLRNIQWDRLRERLSRDTLSQTIALRKNIGALLGRFLATTQGVRTLDDCRLQGEQMLADERVWRCFVLDESGCQIGRSINSRAAREVGDPRLVPMARTKGASWHHRPYFRRAMEAPGEVYISHPYLSVTDAAMCVTMSIALPIAGRTYVLCCDIADDDYPEY